MKKKTIEMEPIGKVRIEGNEPKTIKFYLDIFKSYRSGLKELEKFSHVLVFWWASEMDKEEYRESKKWEVEVPYAEGAPITGIFATRAEYRPNPIAITVCEIKGVDIQNGVIKVASIDAFNDTPIVDLKAYFPICDRVRECNIAPWLEGWPECVEDGIVWWQEQGFFEEG